MAYAHIIEVSFDPIPPEEQMDESTIWATHPGFIGEIADFISDDPVDREDACQQMAHFARGYEMGTDVKGWHITVTDKKSFFRPLWEAFKKAMSSTVTLEKFMSYRGEDDKFSTYIFADGELMTFAEFIRGCALNERYYIGGLLNYHC